MKNSSSFTILRDSQEEWFKSDSGSDKSAKSELGSFRAKFGVLINRPGTYNSAWSIQFQGNSHSNKIRPGYELKPVSPYISLLFGDYFWICF